MVEVISVMVKIFLRGRGSKKFQGGLDFSQMWEGLEISSRELKNIPKELRIF